MARQGTYWVNFQVGEPVSASTIFLASIAGEESPHTATMRGTIGVDGQAERISPKLSGGVA